MNWKDLLQAVLVSAVAFLLHLYFTVIGITIDPVLFNTIVSATVIYLLSKFGVEVAKYFKVRGIQ